ncbi:MAG: cyclophilin-like fold protein [Promethearchaeia archaeon]
MSESETQIAIEFEDGTTLNGILDRVRGPMITEEIISRLPIQTRSAMIRGEMRMNLDIGKGNVKPTKEVTRGDIAYMPLGDSLVIYLEDSRTFSKVNVIGTIEPSSHDKLDKLREIRRGSQVVLRPPS